MAIFAKSMLRNPIKTCPILIIYHVQQIPYKTLWKQAFQGGVGEGRAMVNWKEKKSSERKKEFWKKKAFLKDFLFSAPDRSWFWKRIWKKTFIFLFYIDSENFW